jgi:predicted  nucleic acid-binding Zn-ribbon protein
MVETPHQTGGQNGWNEYSRLVLKELETLSQGIVNLNVEIQDIKREIALIKDREDKVEDLKVWKEKLDDVVSPSQLKDLIKEVQELRAFKTKATTIFLVIQFIIIVLNMMKDKIFH